jgi:hypothetical protein
MGWSRTTSCHLLCALWLCFLFLGILPSEFDSKLLSPARCLQCFALSLLMTSHVLRFLLKITPYVECLKTGIAPLHVLCGSAFFLLKFFDLNI